MPTPLQSIQSPLNASSTPLAIVNLHAALLFLGYSISVFEQRAKSYGADTRKAIRGIQNKNPLPERDGFIGPKTAKFLNEQLEERGAFDPQMYRLNGQVFNENIELLPDVTISLLSLTLKGAKPYQNATKWRELSSGITFGGSYR